MNDTAERLMDLAEGHIRHAGYNGFSFLKLGDELGIKSASIHYHFRTKAAMAAAVAKRVNERFFAAIEADFSKNGGNAIASYRKILRSGMEDEGKMCLFGMFSAEADGLPEEVAKEATLFFERSIQDLSKRIGGKKSRTRAMQVIATLEGAMLLARALKDIKVFDEATSALD